MKKNKLYKKLAVLVLIAVAFVSACKDDEVDPVLTVSPTTLVIPPTGSSSEIAITSNENWRISNAADWVQIDKINGTSGASTINVTIGANNTASKRNAILNVSSDNGQARQIKISQESSVPAWTLIYPSYNTSPQPADASGMSSNAVQLASKIKLGWNLGNTLEAMNNVTTGNETAWGNPLTTKAHIDLVKASGFNAVRLPCGWNLYLADKSKSQIKLAWLNRVKEVVQYCVDNDMYVLLNIHWDGGWLDENISVAKQDSTMAKQRAMWEQIATHLRDFDEHLMFASANEPPVDNADKMKILNAYHQAFVDAVRSTGGRNAYRNLVIQGPSTDIERTEALMTDLPADPIPNRMMIEVHYYGPFQFCGLTDDVDWGKMFYFWGNGFASANYPDRAATWGKEDYVVTTFQKMKTKFVDKGIPVVLGEYGAIRRPSRLSGDDLATHLASRAYWGKYITQQAISHGMLPFYWDEGSLDNNGFGIIDRKNLKVGDQMMLDALIEGSK